ncbi:MAG: hypothetical protein IJX16_00220 [Clostridia bacterium]|nr:hypothetical protein [Clostridia bacterium]
MEKQEFLNRVVAIGQCDDDVQRRELLSQLSEEAGKDYDNLATLTETNATLLNERETLREANMKMFLRIGEAKDAEVVKENETGIKKEEPVKKSFDDLFNEKGEIK